MMVDEKKLLAWLRDRAENGPSQVLRIAYAGLVTRIERGDFDKESKKQ